MGAEQDLCGPWMVSCACSGICSLYFFGGRVLELLSFEIRLRLLGRHAFRAPERYCLSGRYGFLKL